MPRLTKSDVGSIWRKSDVLEVDEDEEFERRYNEEHELILIKKEGVVKTVFDYDYLDGFFGEKDCRWCGYNVEEKERCRKCCDRLVENGCKDGKK